MSSGPSVENRSRTSAEPADPVSTDPQAAETSDASAGADRVERVGNRGRWAWLLPTLTFLLGLALGAALLGLPRLGDDSAGSTSPDARATPAAPTPEATPDPQVEAATARARACLRVAERGDEIGNTFGDAVAAIRDLNASALQDVLDRAEQQQRQLTPDVEACRS